MTPRKIPDYPPLAAFLGELATDRRPAPTIAARRLDLGHLIRWYEDDRARPFRLEDLAASDIQRWMRAGNVAASTSNRRKASLRAWLAWAIKQHLIRDDSSAVIADVRLPQREARSVSAATIDALLREARKEPTLPRAAAGIITDPIAIGVHIVRAAAGVITDPIAISVHIVRARTHTGAIAALAAPAVAVRGGCRRGASGLGGGRRREGQGGDQPGGASGADHPTSDMHSGAP